VSTVELVQAYVANGHGIGLSITVPVAKQNPQLRSIPLDGFKPVGFGVLYHTKPAPIVQSFLEAIRHAAAPLQPGTPKPKARRSSA
jgi:DNA-binding transcriptional LysR family regulator